jgi:hypothetical protein
LLYYENFNLNLKKMKTKSLFASVFAILLVMNACKKDSDPAPTPAPTTTNTLKGTISADRTLTNTPGAIDYFIDGAVTVTARLTIEPGVVIVALSGASLEFDGASSALISVGTATAPIVIKSETGLRGAWKGIRFSGSNNAQNNMVYTTVADGGSASFNGDATEKANIRFGNTSQIKMRNCVIANSATYGIYEEKFDDLTITEFENNAFNNNADFPVYINDQNIVSLGNTSTFNGNTKNFIAMVQKDFTGLVGNVIWKKQAVPYYFNDSDGLILGYNTTTGGLTLEAGVRLTMGPGTRIIVGDNTNNTGYLKINGTAAEPVTISGDGGLKGSWIGILIDTESTQNTWSYANINDGGNSTFSSVLNKTNICMGRSTSDKTNLTITSCTSNNSAGFGLSRANSATNVLTGTISGTGNTSGNSGTHD